MTAAGRWFVTPHAVQRYRERLDRSATYEQALAQLIRWSAAAVLKHPDWHPGIDLYRSPKPWRARLYVSRRGPGLPQLVTVRLG